MRILKTTACILVAMGSALSGVFAQGTAFNYQGRLNQNGEAVTGLYDLRFFVHDTATGAGSVAGPLVLDGVGVTNGVFSVSLDFGAGVFTGAPRWLAIFVRTNGTVAYTNLLPRQPLSPAPYAIHAGTASNVINGSVVKSLNNLRDHVSLVAGANVTLTPSGNAITIASTGVGGGGETNSLWSRNGANVHYSAGNVGIGNSAPNARLYVTSQTASPADNTATFFAPGIGPDASHIHYGTTGDWFVRSASSSGKVVLQDFGGNVGIGAADPAAKLDVRGSLILDPGGSPTLYTSASAGEQNRYLNLINSPTFLSASGLKAGGLLVSDSYAFADPGKNDLIVKGSVGIGTASLVSALEIDRQDALRIRGFQPFLTLSDSAGSGLIRKPNRYLQVVDGDLHFSYRPECNLFPCNQAAESQMTIRFNGNVGIGTTTPAARLSITDFSGGNSSGLNITGLGPDGVGMAIESVGPGGHKWALVSGGIFNPFIPGIAGNFRIIDETANATRLVIAPDGNVGIGGLANPQAKLDVQGTTRTTVLTITGGADLAEPFPMKESQIDKGSVVVIDEEHPGRLKLSSLAYDRQVAGIVSGANGVRPGISLNQDGTFEGGENVALTGRVYVLADAADGAIKPGDLLTTSATPGHAMKAADHARAQGAILGKAMSGLKEGKGMVLVLVTLQ